MPPLSFWHQDGFLSHDPCSFSARNRLFPLPGCPACSATHMPLHEKCPLRPLTREQGQLSPARRPLGQCFPSARLLWKLHPVPDFGYHYVPTQESLPSCPPISPAACWTSSSLRCLKPNLPKTELDIFHLQISFSSNFPTQKGACPLRSHPSQKPSIIPSKQPPFSVDCPPYKVSKIFPFTALCPQGPGLVSSFQSLSPGLLQQTLTSPALAGVWTGGETWTPPGLLAVKALRGDERHPSPHHSMRARLGGGS